METETLSTHLTAATNFVTEVRDCPVVLVRLDETLSGSLLEPEQGCHEGRVCNEARCRCRTARPPLQTPLFLLASCDSGQERCDIARL